MVPYLLKKDRHKKVYLYQNTNRMHFRDLKLFFSKCMGMPKAPDSRSQSIELYLCNWLDFFAFQKNFGSSVGKLGAWRVLIMNYKSEYYSNQMQSRFIKCYFLANTDPDSLYELRMYVYFAWLSVGLCVNNLGFCVYRFEKECDDIHPIMFWDCERQKMANFNIYDQFFSLDGEARRQFGNVVDYNHSTYMCANCEVTKSELQDHTKFRLADIPLRGRSRACVMLRHCDNDGAAALKLSGYYSNVTFNNRTNDIRDINVLNAIDYNHVLFNNFKYVFEMIYCRLGTDARITLKKHLNHLAHMSLTETSSTQKVLDGNLTFSQMDRMVETLHVALMATTDAPNHRDMIQVICLYVDFMLFCRSDTTVHNIDIAQSGHTLFKHICQVFEPGTSHNITFQTLHDTCHELPRIMQIAGNPRTYQTAIFEQTNKVGQSFCTGNNNYKGDICRILLKANLERCVVQLAVQGVKWDNLRHVNARGEHQASKNFMNNKYASYINNITGNNNLKNQWLQIIHHVFKGNSDLICNSFNQFFYRGDLNEHCLTRCFKSFGMEMIPIIGYKLIIGSNVTFIQNQCHIYGQIQSMHVKPLESGIVLSLNLFEPNAEQSWIHQKCSRLCFALNVQTCQQVPLAAVTNTCRMIPWPAHFDQKRRQLYFLSVLGQNRLSVNYCGLLKKRVPYS